MGGEESIIFPFFCIPLANSTVPIRQVLKAVSWRKKKHPPRMTFTHSVICYGCGRLEAYSEKEEVRLASLCPQSGAVCAPDRHHWGKYNADLCVPITIHHSILLSGTRTSF